jgi:acyl-CoA thioesterase FadM
MTRCSPLGPCVTRMRVWPNDLDVFLHVNNGVYFTLCDLARVDLLVRSGTFGVVAGPRRPFLVAAQTIQLHRPLGLFQRFEIVTRVLGWDDRAFFVEHRFVGRSGTRAASEGELVALAVVEGRVFEARRNRGQIRPAEILQELGIESESPELPDWVARWRDDQRQLRLALRDRSDRSERTTPDGVPVTGR